MNEQELLGRFRSVGRDLFVSGAITSHGGNLSICDGESVWITRTGSMLGRLEDGDVVRTGFEPSTLDDGCSSELIVHRRLYHAIAEREGCAGEPQRMGQWAVVHAHTLHTTMRSNYFDLISAVDSECKLLLPEPVEVVNPKKTIGSEEAADMLASIVAAGGKIGVIRNHGPFAVGRSLADALQLVSSLEHSCKIATLMEQREILGLLRGMKQ